MGTGTTGGGSYAALQPTNLVVTLHGSTVPLPAIVLLLLFVGAPVLLVGGRRLMPVAAQLTGNFRRQGARRRKVDAGDTHNTTPTE